MPEARDRRHVSLDEAALYAANLRRIASSPFLQFHIYADQTTGRGGSLTPIRRRRVPRKAIERRRTRVGEVEGQQMPDPSVPDAGAHVEHSASAISPNQVSVKLRTPGCCKVPKIMLDVSTPSENESELTPQKQLLNSIDAVEKVVREKLQKLKRTPGAKRAEREKRVRTLFGIAAGGSKTRDQRKLPWIANSFQGERQILILLLFPSFFDGYGSEWSRQQRGSSGHWDHGRGQGNKKWHDQRR
ncbi:hypothetical protein RIF29_25007 [Crotalaria pallida]|uniref:Uncharacterized protein n=1 Tax=Crotalaria pallida TaxID=3830 RepID=A0AAN9EN04_CROPI